MRIALVFSVAPPELGACAVRAMSFARHFQARGHEVRLFAPARRGGAASALCDGVPIVRYRHKNPLGLVPKFMGWAPEVVLASSGPSLVAFAGVAGARWCRRPVIVDVRDLDLPTLLSYGEVRRGSVKHLAFRLFEAVNYRAASRLTVVTEAMRDAIVSDYGVPPDKFVLAPNGVDAAWFQRDEQAGKEVRRQLGIPDGSPVLLFSGTAGPEFALPTLMEHLAPLANGNGQAAARRPYFLFLLVYVKGSWPERAVKELQATAERLGVARQCRFLDGVPVPEMARYFSAADLALNPNPDPYPHCLPVKTYEYAACQLPQACKSPAGSELERFITRHQIGFSVSTWTQFAAELRARLSSLDEFRRLGRHAPAAAPRRSETARVVLAELERLVSGAKR